MVVLLVGAGLLLKSLVLLRSVYTGFETRRLITATLPLPETSYGTAVRRQVLVELTDGAIAASAGKYNWWDSRIRWRWRGRS